MFDRKLATFGNGCFWCTEAIFLRLKGVESVKSGYSGGQTEDPTYKEVCSGDTGYAEVIQIEFNPKEISFTEILEVFWNTHDPTTLNRQGNDVGTQYRSAIFYHDDEQMLEARTYKAQLDEAKVWSDPIVTEIVPFEKFYPSEDYHDNYLAGHGHEPYCAFVVRPKVEKFEKKFADRLKS